ncbi:MAG: GHKL domain-containing protein [Bacteroidales bacterium]|jgi:two-component system phosphate regulon sensor histidine kinase PhoR|nr:GHKL domain-containing protein [Bacteroidales bacterium]
MKTKYLALIISLLALVIDCFAIFVLNHYKIEDNFTILFSILIISFLVFFLIIYIILKKEITDKALTIYRNIYNYKLSKNNTKELKRLENKSLNEVNKDVKQWMKDKDKQFSNIAALEKYRKEYIGDVAHELKTPIFNIQGYVSTLLDGAMEDKALTKKYLIRTEASIDRLIAIVQDLNTITQLELNEVPLEISSFDIIDLINEVVDSFEFKIQNKDIKIVFEEEGQIFVEADKKKIRQVLVNLMDNAIKYSKNQKGKILIKIFDMLQSILIEITDEGIGIEEKDIDRVFERFYRTDKARSSKDGGSGLGLAIVKHIIEAHNQTINLRSKYNEGTTFGFTLKKA